MNAPSPGVTDASADTLGRYEILRRLAVGGMAEIYLARVHGIEAFEQLVALKRLKPELSHDMQFVSMFLDEARLMAELRHTNIPHVHDVVAADGSYFLTMELLHGADLRHVLGRLRARGERLSYEHAVTIATRVLSGLHHAHERRRSDGTPLEIVHRDVSPPNIFVTYEGGVKVLDFGIARTKTHRHDTGFGVFKGKVRYMAPEQVRSEEVDRRADIFSLGVVLWEMTTGRALFDDDADQDVMHHILDHDAPRPSTVIEDYPRELEEIVMRALRRDPAERYATARDMHAALEDWAHDNKASLTSLHLAEFMRALFAEDLLEWDASLQELKENATPRVIESARLIERTRHSEDTGVCEALSSEGARAVVSSEGSTARPAPRRTSTKWVFAAGALFFVLALVGLAVRASAKRGEPTTSFAPTPSTTGSGEPAIVSMQAAPPQSAEPAAAIEILSPDPSTTVPSATATAAAPEITTALTTATAAYPPSLLPLPKHLHTAASTSAATTTAASAPKPGSAAPKWDPDSPLPPP